MHGYRVQLDLFEYIQIYTTSARMSARETRILRRWLKRACASCMLERTLVTSPPTMLGAPGTEDPTVPIRTLDELAETAALGHIDLVKVYVEEYEPEVFAGAAQLFATRRVRAIPCELNAHWLARGGTTSNG